MLEVVGIGDDSCGSASSACPPCRRLALVTELGRGDRLTSFVSRWLQLLGVSVEAVQPIRGSIGGGLSGRARTQRLVRAFGPRNGAPGRVADACGHGSLQSRYDPTGRVGRGADFEPALCSQASALTRLRYARLRRPLRDKFRVASRKRIVGSHGRPAARAGSPRNSGCSTGPATIPKTAVPPR